MRISFYILLLVAAGALAGCGDDKKHSQIDEGEPISVSTAKVVAKEMEEPVIYSATVEAGDRAEMATKVMGRIEAIYVKEGDYVKAGQMLVKISSKDIDAKLAQTEAQIAAASAQFENAEKNLKRFEALYAQNAATPKEMDDVRLGYEAALAQKKAAEGMKKEVEDIRRYARLTSPFNGVVAAKMVDIGDMASPGYPIIVVESVGSIKVSALVSESEIDYWHVGMSANVIVPSLNGDEKNAMYEAKVTQVVPSADPASHQFKVKAKILNPDKSIKPGMFARIVVGKLMQKTIAVPKSALFNRGQLVGVYVVGDDNRAKLRWIRTGRDLGKYIEVLSGMESGETVVLDNKAQLKDIQKVKVVNQTSGRDK